MANYVFEKVRFSQLRAWDRIQLDSPAFRGKRIATVSKVLPSNQPEFTVSLSLNFYNEGNHKMSFAASDIVRRVVRSY